MAISLFGFARHDIPDRSFNRIEGPPALAMIQPVPRCARAAGHMALANRRSNRERSQEFQGTWTAVVLRSLSALGQKRRFDRLLDRNVSRPRRAIAYFEDSSWPRAALGLDEIAKIV